LKDTHYDSGFLLEKKLFTLKINYPQALTNNVCEIVALIATKAMKRRGGRC